MMYLNKYLMLATCFFFALSFAKAQEIPKYYFLKNTSPSNSFTYISYSMGYFLPKTHTRAIDGGINESIGQEGVKLAVFIPQKRGYRKGLLFITSYSKYLSNFVYAPDEGHPYYQQGNTLTSSFLFQLKRTYYSSFALAIAYEYHPFVINGNKIADYHGVGLEMSLGDIPRNLESSKTKWPFSLDVGSIFYPQTDGMNFYGDLALRRMKKKRGVSLFFEIFMRYNFYAYDFIYFNNYEVKPYDDLKAGISLGLLM